MILKPQLIKIKQINKIIQNHSSDILPQLIKLQFISSMHSKTYRKKYGKQKSYSIKN